MEVVVVSTFVAELNSDFSPDPEENVFSSIWNEYERVIIKSLITSFGLDFIVHDQHGGDGCSFVPTKTG